MYFVLPVLAASVVLFTTKPTKIYHKVHKEAPSNIFITTALQSPASLKSPAQKASSGEDKAGQGRNLISNNLFIFNQLHKKNAFFLKNCLPTFVLFVFSCLCRLGGFVYHKGYKKAPVFLVSLKPPPIFSIISAISPPCRGKDRMGAPTINSKMP